VNRRQAPARDFCGNCGGGVAAGSQWPAVTVVNAVAVAFEVATIKSRVPADIASGIRPVTAGGQFRAVLTLHDLIRVAYGAPLALSPRRLSEGPSWVTGERFEIAAKAKAEGLVDAPAGGRDLLSAMMRTLLADRFQFRFHRQSRQLPIFNLVVERPDGRLGPRLRPEDGQCVPFSTPSAAADPTRRCGFTRVTAVAISARGMSIDDFASGIATRPEIQRVIRNRTGLYGKFDLDLEFSAASSAGNDVPPTSARPDSEADLFTALREQLGLKLEGAAGPVDVLVIDRVERPTLD
jgi:uncharacterized protein (TIGR03435 family)